MTTLLLTQKEITSILGMQECMDVMADTLGALARGEALNPLRWAMPLPGGAGLLGMMPASLEHPAVFGLKALSVFPGNHGTDRDSHQGFVILFDPENGAPRAIIDATSITAIRTAAVSGVATRILAREDAGDLAILGSGVQARSHLEAMHLARTLRRVRVHSPTSEHLLAFAYAQSRQLGIAVEPMETPAEAVRDADIICATTSSREPILRGEWIAPGAHINAVGACLPTARELDGDAVARSRLFVDRRESALKESGDLLLALAEGKVSGDPIRGELGEVLIGKVAGRQSPTEITLFESLGLGVEDLAAAQHVYTRASQLGIGTEIDFGGLRVVTDR